MAEIVNLRTARKRKARSEREAEAARNRAEHGRSKADRQRDRAIEEKNRNFVDGHFRSGSDSDR
jgi:hypothetical protein